jgi:hypothetical protein
VIVDYRGQQIFIIHPDNKFRDELVQFIRNNEFETFGVDEPNATTISNRRESILFLHSSEDENWHWQSFVEQIRVDCPDQLIVALGTGNKPEGIDIYFDHAEEDVGGRIIKYLDEINARGHRHFIRFGSQNASIATFDYQYEGMRYAGIIHDISIADISCTFKPEPETVGHMSVGDLHLNLPGFRASINGRFTTGRVVAGQKIHVFHFIGNISDEYKNHIHDFIYSSLELKLSLH